MLAQGTSGDLEPCQGSKAAQNIHPEALQYTDKSLIQAIEQCLQVLHYSTPGQRKLTLKLASQFWPQGQEVKKSRDKAM